MTLRERVLILSGLALVGSAAALQVSSQRIFFARFLHMEQESVATSMIRVYEALAAQVDAVDVTALDWAKWDDTYDFMQSNSEAYQRSNLNIDTLAGIRLGLLCFITTEGIVRYEADVDAKAWRYNLFPAAARGILQGGSYAFKQCMQNKSVSGLVMLPDGPVLVSAQPILSSHGEGPVRGMLVMGRRLDEDAFVRLRRTSDHRLAMFPVGDATLAKEMAGATEFTQRGYTIFVKPLNDGVVAGYAVARDIEGRPSAILRAIMPRDIVAQAQGAMSSNLIAIIAAGLTATALVFGLFESFVLLPLARLRRDIVWLSARHALADRLTVNGTDEMALTAIEVNRLLDVVEDIHRGAREHVARRTQAGDSAHAKP